MIIVDDSLHKCQPKPPPALLGGITRIENILEVLALNALSRVFDFDEELLLVAACGDVDLPASPHGVYGILGQVFHHPFKQGFRHQDSMIVGREIHADVYFPRNSPFHVLQRLSHNVVDIFQLQFRTTPYL